MPAVVFPAIVTGDRASGYVASFPDLPGCTANAADQASLLNTAREALRQRLTQLATDGEEWPEASELSALPLGPKAKGATVLLVDVDMNDTPVRVNISIGERLLKRIDHAAESRGMTRSGFIAASAKQSLGDGPFAQWDSKKVHDTFTDYSRSFTEKFGPGSDFARGFNDLDRKITRSAEHWAEQIAQALRNKQGPVNEPVRPEPTTAEDPQRQV